MIYTVEPMRGMWARSTPSLSRCLKGWLEPQYRGLERGLNGPILDPWIGSRCTPPFGTVPVGIGILWIRGPECGTPFGPLFTPLIKGLFIPLIRGVLAPY